jgi:hypothetical protein
VTLTPTVIDKKTGKAGGAPSVARARQIVTSGLNWVRPHYEHVSFITLHYAYFCATCLIAGIVFWGSSTPSQSVRFIDSIFLAVSAMTEAGLNTVNLSTL